MNRRNLLKSLLVGAIAVPFIGKAVAKNSNKIVSNKRYALVVKNYIKDDSINFVFAEFKDLKKGDIFRICNPVGVKEDNISKHYWVAESDSYLYSTDNYGINTSEYNTIEEAIKNI